MNIKDKEMKLNFIQTNDGIYIKLSDLLVYLYESDRPELARAIKKSSEQVKWERQ